MESVHSLIPFLWHSRMWQFKSNILFIDFFIFPELSALPPYIKKTHNARYSTITLYFFHSKTCVAFFASTFYSLYMIVNQSARKTVLYKEWYNVIPNGDDFLFIWTAYLVNYSLKQRKKFHNKNWAISMFTMSAIAIHFSYKYLLVIILISFYLGAVHCDVII